MQKLPKTEFELVVIGSGFGATMTALTIAQRIGDQRPDILMLERGTWWTTPVPTVQDKTIATAKFLKERGQPVQYWSSVEHFKGFIDLVLRCFRRPKNEDGLYELTQLGKRTWFGLKQEENDGVTVLRACGVGGGSLVYSNITIRPPDFVLADERWPLTWTAEERNSYYDLARHAIGYGVVSAWIEHDKGNIPFQDPTGQNQLPAGSVNEGLSNIVTRSARLNPHWTVVTDPHGRELKRITIDPDPKLPSENQNRLWIDRARVFQTAMSELTNDFGTVDSSINDLTPEGLKEDPQRPQNYPGKPLNYCERQGRCNVGCLPGARQPLNKQLMAAIFGKIDGTPPLFNDKDDNEHKRFHLHPLTEVDIIHALPNNGGYEIEYWQRDENKPSRKTSQKVRAKRVIIAAGCLGTNEILLRSKARGGLPHLSRKVGSGFSTNGDYIAFLEGLDKPVSLTRGPVTTSFGHFNTPEAEPGKPVDTKKFHMIEDQGIPRAAASTIGFGIPVIRMLTAQLHHSPRLFALLLIARWLWHRLGFYVLAFFKDASERQQIFESEDEFTNNMMCIVAQGRESSVGQFRLGASPTESPLRVKRTDNLSFTQDPIFAEVRSSLARLAAKLGSTKNFINPFIGGPAKVLKAESIATSHPLGGCSMAQSVVEGVVDEYGRVFYDTDTNTPAYYQGLYVADSSILPTALGVNPSLTISALSLRIADHLVKDIQGQVSA